MITIESKIYSILVWIMPFCTGKYCLRSKYRPSLWGECNDWGQFSRCRTDKRVSILHNNWVILSSYCIVCIFKLKFFELKLNIYYLFAFSLVEMFMKQCINTAILTTSGQWFASVVKSSKLLLMPYCPPIKISQSIKSGFTFASNS